ncbi:MAG: class II SORL domain-containing protein [Candidatus Omnitrophota bacterium]
MSGMRDLFQSADWKKEKHVPVIEAPGKAKKGDFIEAKVTIGKEIPHPNTTEHHIRWVEAYFLAEGERFPVQLARFEFTAHGESVQGPNLGSVYTRPEAAFSFRADKAGMLTVSSYCNIHGLWENVQRIEVE